MTISVVSGCVFGQEDPRGLLGAQLEWIRNKYNTLIFHINIDHVFQLNILLKITFNAYKIKVDYSKKIPIKRPVEKKAVRLYW